MSLRMIQKVLCGAGKAWLWSCCVMEKWNDSVSHHLCVTQHYCVATGKRLSLRMAWGRKRGLPLFSVLQCKEA